MIKNILFLFRVYFSDIFLLGIKTLIRYSTNVSAFSWSNLMQYSFFFIIKKKFVVVVSVLIILNDNDGTAVMCCVVWMCCIVYWVKWYFEIMFFGKVSLRYYISYSIISVLLLKMNIFTLFVCWDILTFHASILSDWAIIIFYWEELLIYLTLDLFSPINLLSYSLILEYRLFALYVQRFVRKYYFI